MESVLLSAPIEDICKQLKNEGKALKYFERQLQQKFPDSQLPDQLFTDLLKEAKKNKK